MILFLSCYPLPIPTSTMSLFSHEIVHRDIWPEEVKCLCEMSLFLQGFSIIDLVNIETIAFLKWIIFQSYGTATFRNPTLKKKKVY